MAGGIATSQVTVDTTSGGVLIAPDRPGRTAVILINEGAVDVRLGVKGVTTGTGALLAGTKGSALTIGTSGAIFGITASSQVVSVVEIY